MEAVAQPVIEGPRPLAWFREFLEEELAPYPGRAALVTRMVTAATLVMLITMTFRLPFGMHGAIFTFVISRESPRATMKAVRTILIAFGFAAVYVCSGAMFSLDDPMLRFLWIIATLFIAFYLGMILSAPLQNAWLRLKSCSKATPRAAWGTSGRKRRLPAWGWPGPRGCDASWYAQPTRCITVSK